MSRTSYVLGDNIGSSSDFWSTKVQLSNCKYVIYGRPTTIDDSLSLDLNGCHNPLITYLNFTIL